MSAGATAYKQDLPPPGGYGKPIPFKRIPAKTYMSGVTMFVVFNIIHFGSIFGWKKYTWIPYEEKNVENRSARLAIQPMLYAEKERLYLKRLRRLREEEEEVMKDVPGWVVGTYWGEPIFHTRPENEWFDINSKEYMAHSHDRLYRFFVNFYKWL